MNLLCPACHTPLPEVEAAAAEPVVTCPACAAEVDVSRAGTQAGRPRFVPEVDRTGSQIGGYRVEELIGGGGMGTVYRAISPDGAPVALKVLSQSLGDAPAFVARFAREVEALARLDHPAIVRVLANGTDGGVPWFAMELCDGPDLKTRLLAGPLPPDEVSAVFGRLFEALAHAHERGVVHRDLKPANVLLSPGGAKLADFGIARFDAAALTRSQAVTRLTETAVVIGSLPYMSPEQKRGAPVDGRSDLFSAGVMLYEASTGAIPQGAFSPPSQLDPRYGRAFDQLVMQLLHPEPERRPTSAAQAGRALTAGTRGPGLRVLARRTAVAAGLAFAVLVATFGGWTALRGGASVRGSRVGAGAQVTRPEPPGATPAAPSPSGGPEAPAQEQAPAANSLRPPVPVAPPVAAPVAPPDDTTGDFAVGKGKRRAARRADSKDAPPNLQAIIDQSLDRSPPKATDAPDARQDLSLPKKKATAPKYRVDVKLSKAGSNAKTKGKARAPKIVPLDTPSDGESLLDEVSSKAAPVEPLELGPRGKASAPQQQFRPDPQSNQAGAIPQQPAESFSVKRK